MIVCPGLPNVSGSADLATLIPGAGMNVTVAVSEASTTFPSGAVPFTVAALVMCPAFTSAAVVTCTASHSIDSPASSEVCRADDRAQLCCPTA